MAFQASCHATDDPNALANIISSSRMGAANEDNDDDEDDDEDVEDRRDAKAPKPLPTAPVMPDSHPRLDWDDGAHN